MTDWKRDRKTHRQTNKVGKTVATGFWSSNFYEGNDVCYWAADPVGDEIGRNSVRPFVCLFIRSSVRPFVPLFFHSFGGTFKPWQLSERPGEPGEPGGLENGEPSESRLSIDVLGLLTLRCWLSQKAFQCPMKALKSFLQCIQIRCKVEYF